MATKKTTTLNDAHVQKCLKIIEQLYQEYTADEITEAFKINRQNITKDQEQQAIENQIEELKESLDKVDEE